MFYFLKPHYTNTLADGTVLCCLDYVHSVYTGGSERGLSILE